MNGAVRVLLADDHALMRAGMRALLQRLDWLEIVGEAADGREAVELARRCTPGLVLMDISMPGLNGLEATARIRKANPQVRVVVLSMYGTREYVLKALRAGATGFVVKGGSTAELELALQSVASGGLFVGPSAEGAGDHLQLATAAECAPDDPLTPRQREILQLLAEGKSAKQVARALNLSVKTIESHRAAIAERLGIYDFAGLVRYAIRAGIVSPGG